jgi:hypothetical protein
LTTRTTLLERVERGKGLPRSVGGVLAWRDGEVQCSLLVCRRSMRGEGSGGGVRQGQARTISRRKVEETRRRSHSRECMSSLYLCLYLNSCAQKSRVVLRGELQSWSQVSRKDDARGCARIDRPNHVMCKSTAGTVCSGLKRLTKLGLLRATTDSVRLHVLPRFRLLLCGRIVV